jgi:hypothetical protein
MRGIVIAKMLVLTLWGVYLAVGLLHETDLDEGLARPTSRSCHFAIRTDACEDRRIRLDSRRARPKP